jgi:hypothetical protein
VSESQNHRPGAAAGRKATAQHAIVETLRRCGLKIVLLAAPPGYLRSTGWVASARRSRPIDIGGEPQPWLSMPAIRFLGQRLSGDQLLLEYGAGGSTTWFGRHVGRVISVEHDAQWFNEVKSQVPPNAAVQLCELTPEGEFLDLVFRPLGEPTDYALSVATLPPRPPDVIVIDGVDRLNCVAVALNHAAPTGVIVVDNLEYEQPFAPAVQLLRDAGWRELPFWGLAPGELRESCTSIFYRPGNCLGI